MNEILSGAKVLKLYGWEKSFIGQVMGIRLGEVKASDLSSSLSFINHTVVHHHIFRVREYLRYRRYEYSTFQYHICI